MKVYSVTVDASSRYPIPVTYQIEASSWATAIARGVKKYFKEHAKRLGRPTLCSVRTRRIMSIKESI